MVARFPLPPPDCFGEVLRDDVDIPLNRTWRTRIGRVVVENQRADKTGPSHREPSIGDGMLLREVWPSFAAQSGRFYAFCW